MHRLSTSVFSPDVQHENGSDEQQRHDEDRYRSAASKQRTSVIIQQVSNNIIQPKLINLQDHPWSTSQRHLQLQMF